MDITTPFLSVLQLGIVPLVIGLVSVFKGAGITGVEHRFAPVISLALGVAGAFLLPSETWQHTVLAGLTIGCIAAGVYSGVKTTVSSDK